MRLSRLFFGGGLFTCVLLTVAGGCQDPTQMTLDISLDRRARCEEIASGVAITVGADPVNAESYVSQGYVHARTTSCDFGTGHIGTLVVTPSDSGKGAVVVVAGYKGNDPTSCKPPSYTGCIVARRRFTFAEHTRLRMPILIDPDCANVPCDAFSTCSRGRCVDSTTECANGVCEVSGAPADGGVDDGSVVSPDSGDPRDGDVGPIVDASTDAPGLEDASPGTSCSENPAWCGGQRCGPGMVCCNGTCAPSCTGTRICCTNADCGGDDTCIKEAGVDALGVCTTGPVPQCNPELTCGGEACNGNACCSDYPSACFTGNECPIVANNQYCCKRDDCPAGYECSRVDSQNTPGLCFREPHCDASNNLVCNDSPCTIGSFCCTTDPPGTSCHEAPACSPLENQYCCKDEDCPTDYECNNLVAGTLSTCKRKDPGPQGPDCNGDMDLVCGGEVCSTTAKTACCSSASQECSFGCTPGDQLCCKDTECPGNEVCDFFMQPAGSVGKCRNPQIGGSDAGVVSYPRCENQVLVCTVGQTCAYCCAQGGGQCVPDAGACLGPLHCCNDGNCPSGTCSIQAPSPGVVAAGTCM